MSSRATQGGRPSVFRQLDTVRAHARHHLSEVGETAVSLERHSRLRQLLAARPRLGDPSEVGWYDAIDDTSSIVRATLQTAVRADPDFRLLRVGSQLIYYWYYRRRVIEARHWLEDVLATIDAPATGEAGSVEVTMARLALAGVSLPAGRVDPAVPLIDAALQSLEWIPADLLLEVGELLIAVADTGWAKNEFAIVARLSAALNEIALISGDPCCC